ncbi:MAG: cation diffusion facilitator family transporter [Anaerolineae bacterium]|nr:cation diffusion facilitator family transporter [Anaerolineae bacterium]
MSFSFNHKHGHPNETEHNHDHTHVDEQSHSFNHGWIGWILDFIHPVHEHSLSINDPALATGRGIRAIKISLAGLLLTALFQAGVVLASGSMALLADTLHNFADAFTAIPLWLAFWLSGRARNRRYTYGYGRAEDLVGAAIILIIFFSALEILYQSYDRIINPRVIEHVGWVAAAALIGFVGNEGVAIFRLRTGREIQSAALVADGMHARVDGFTSLGVLAGVIGVWAGFPLADALVGFGLGFVILAVALQAGRDIWFRLMDATDPQLITRIEQVSANVPGVIGVGSVYGRWLGHRQFVELSVVVDGNLSTCAGHQIGEAVRHALLHALPAAAEVIVHIDPFEATAGCEHRLSAHHFGAGSLL